MTRTSGMGRWNVRPAETGLFNLGIEGNGKKIRGRSTLSQETVLRSRLLKVVCPGGVVGVWEWVSLSPGMGEWQGDTDLYRHRCTC